MNKKKWIWIVAIVIALLVSSLIYYQKFNLLGGCSTKIFKEISSDTNRIEISIVDCGATTDYATRIILKDVKNTTETKIVVLKGDHSTDLNVVWITPEKVEIKYKGLAQEAFNFQSRINNINFELKTFN